MKRTLRPTACLVLLLALAALLTSCMPITRSAHPKQQKTPFIPPTPAEVPTPTVAPTNTPSSGVGSQPDPASCKNVLTFVSDVTIPDGTTVAPNSTMDKRWEVENSGTCNWSDAYRVRLIAGDEMGAQKEQALFPARSGSRTTIRILFKAPAEPGNYRSAWQAYDPQGEPFGDPFFIDIAVSAAP